MFLWRLCESHRSPEEVISQMWTSVRHEISNLHLSCQGVIIIDTQSTLVIQQNLFCRFDINSDFCLAASSHGSLQITFKEWRWRTTCSNDSCIVKDCWFMYVFSWCSVLIFKTDNNKMLYLNFGFVVSFLCVRAVGDSDIIMTILVCIMHLLCNCFRC